MNPIEPEFLGDGIVILRLRINVMRGVQVHEEVAEATVQRDSTPARRGRVVEISIPRGISARTADDVAELVRYAGRVAGT